MIEENEIWKPVVGYEGLYEVSSFGRIKRIAPARGTSVGHIFTPAPDKKGYLRTRLTDFNGIAKTIKVHRVVCTAFHPNPNSLPQVNHKDCNKSNNREDNLEWTSNLDNNRHARLNNLIPAAFLGKFGKDHNRSIRLMGVHLKTGEIREFFGQAQAARELGTTTGSIHRVRTGEYRHTKGWHIKNIE